MPSPVNDTQFNTVYPQSNIPLQRLAKSEEIAALASYLASDEATSITGQSLVIDGGECAGGLASKPRK